MDSSFNLLSKDQRNAMKSLLVQIEAINKYSGDIKDSDVTEEKIDEIINNYKSYLYTGSCMLNTMRIVINKTNLFQVKVTMMLLKKYSTNLR